MGDRIAQPILEKIGTPPVEEVQGLDYTVRGVGGFGSIGVHEKKIKVMSKMDELVKRTKWLKMRL